MSSARVQLSDQHTVTSYSYEQPPSVGSVAMTKVQLSDQLTNSTSYSNIQPPSLGSVARAQVQISDQLIVTSYDNEPAPSVGLLAMAEIQLSDYTETSYNNYEQTPSMTMVDYRGYSPSASESSNNNVHPSPTDVAGPDESYTGPDLMDIDNNRLSLSAPIPNNDVPGAYRHTSEECVGVSNVKRIDVGQESPKSNHSLTVEEKQKSDEYASPFFGTTFRTLDVETARNMFISSLSPDLKVDIFEVKKCSSGFVEARFELFQKQVEITQKLRGDANVQYGWFAADGDAPSGMMFFGLNEPKLGRYGFGVHLAAVQPANLSTMVCDVDEKGLQHMVLCCVILGNMEVVHAGSKQFCPSDQCFDSGVDKLLNPNIYVIWNINMNTHIFPEFVISFKASPTVKGDLVGEESRPHMPRITTTHDPHGLLNQDFGSNKLC